MRAVLLYLTVIVTVIWMASEKDFDREHLPITASMAPAHISDLPLPDPHDLDNLSVVPAAQAGSVREIVYVKGAIVNIRSGPGLSYRMIDVVERGAVVEIDGEWRGEWAPVYEPQNGVKGWMNSAYLSASPVE